MQEDETTWFPTLTNATCFLTNCLLVRQRQEPRSKCAITLGPNRSENIGLHQSMVGFMQFMFESVPTIFNSQQNVTSPSRENFGRNPNHGRGSKTHVWSFHTEPWGWTNPAPVAGLPSVQLLPTRRPWIFRPRRKKNRKGPRIKINRCPLLGCSTPRDSERIGQLEIT